MRKLPVKQFNKHFCVLGDNMKTIIDYLDDLKEKFGSDYRTAKLLNTSKTNISTIRKRQQCGDETALKMAELLEVSQEEILIAAAIARSNDTVKKAWERISQKAGMTAGLYIAVGTAYPALINGVTAKFIALSEYYVKLKKRRLLITVEKKNRRLNERFLPDAHEGWINPKRRWDDV